VKSRLKDGCRQDWPPYIATGTQSTAFTCLPVNFSRPKAPVRTRHQSLRLLDLSHSGASAWPPSSLIWPPSPVHRVSRARERRTARQDRDRAGQVPDVHSCLQRLRWRRPPRRRRSTSTSAVLGFQHGPRRRARTGV